MVVGFVRAVTMMFLEATTAARHPALELQPPLVGGIPRRSCLVPPASPAPQPHTACVAACAVPCRPRRSPAPSPRRVRSNPTPCHRPWSCPTSPHEDAIGERERIEEKDYGRERRGCGMKIWKKEEKWWRKRKGKKKNMEKGNDFFINYVFKIILIKLLLGNWI
jgi:hypothetical protein